MFVLDGVCMKLIFIGESVKTIDKLSEGELFSLYPVIPWKEIMKLRDVIAHHYLKIDVAGNLIIDEASYSIINHSSIIRSPHGSAGYAH